VDPDGPNDIDVSRMLTGGGKNNDFTIGGSPELQLRIRDILHDFRDIFSYNVKGKAMAVPPMAFTVDKVNWEAPSNRLPSRHISVEKHAALNQMIDDLLDLQVIQPSRATAWSQVHLVRNQLRDGGLRLTFAILTNLSQMRAGKSKT